MYNFHVLHVYIKPNQVFTHPQQHVPVSCKHLFLYQGSSAGVFSWPEYFRWRSVHALDKVGLSARIIIYDVYHLSLNKWYLKAFNVLTYSCHFIEILHYLGFDLVLRRIPIVFVILFCCENAFNTLQTNTNDKFCMKN